VGFAIILKIAKLLYDFGMPFCFVVMKWTSMNRLSYKNV